MYILHIWRCDHVNFHCDASEIKLNMKPAHFIYFLQPGIIPFGNLSISIPQVHYEKKLFLKEKNQDFI